MPTGAAVNGDPIPSAVRRLLERRFRSISQVEAFVLLVREERTCDAEAVAHALGLGARHVEGLLDELVSNKLVRQVDDGYQLGQLSDADLRTAKTLADLYSRYRLRIMDIVLAPPRDQARDFADAFRLRPGDTEEDED